MKQQYLVQKVRSIDATLHLPECEAVLPNVEISQLFSDPVEAVKCYFSLVDEVNNQGNYVKKSGFDRISREATEDLIKLASITLLEDTRRTVNSSLYVKQDTREGCSIALEALIIDKEIQKSPKGKVLVTGTATGIGHATAKLFAEKGYEVHGFDIYEIDEDNQIFGEKGGSYKHYIVDVSKPDTFPEIDAIDILVNNAGTDHEPLCMDVNAMGYFYIAEKYGVLNYDLKALVNVCSISATTGIEPPLYVMSQGARYAYTKNLALRLSHRGVLVNAIVPAGVFSPLNDWLIEDAELMEEVKKETLLHKWSDPSEAAELIYFLTVHNKSIQGQFIPIDNGESAKHNFIANDAMKRKFYRGACADIPYPTEEDRMMHKPKPIEAEVLERNMFVMQKGKVFHCESCGSNMFSRIKKDGQICYRCQSCSTIYGAK
ncbi:MAG: SDR family oxidoreductase [Acetobacter sp.]|nr:SDR family oxidoreductase [Acetobacter sp.]